MDKFFNKYFCAKYKNDYEFLSIYLSMSEYYRLNKVL